MIPDLGPSTADSHFIYWAEICNQSTGTSCCPTFTDIMADNYLTFDTGPYLGPFVENLFNVQHNNDREVQETCTDFNGELFIAISQKIPNSNSELGAAISREILLSTVSQESERELHSIMPQHSDRQSPTAISQEILLSTVSQDSERELLHVMPQDSDRQSPTAISQVSEGESLNACTVSQNTPDSEEKLPSQSMLDSRATGVSQKMPANVSLECSSMRLVTGMLSLGNVASTEELVTGGTKTTGISS